jgi:hypothetical protein
LRTAQSVSNAAAATLPTFPEVALRAVSNGLRQSTGTSTAPMLHSAGAFFGSTTDSSAQPGNSYLSYPRDRGVSRRDYAAHAARFGRINIDQRELLASRSHRYVQAQYFQRARMHTVRSPDYNAQ